MTVHDEMERIRKEMEMFICGLFNNNAKAQITYRASNYTAILPNEQQSGMHVEGNGCVLI
jgi:hypothetical protein